MYEEFAAGKRVEGKRKRDVDDQGDPPLLEDAPRGVSC